MGWTASYQLLRETPLSPEEIGALALLNQQVGTEPWECEAFSVSIAPAPRPDQVLAFGCTKLPNGDSEDPDRLQLALDRLAALVAGAELRVVDDYGFFAPARGRQPVWIDVEWDAFVDPASLAPPPLQPLLESLAAHVAAEEAGAAPVITEPQMIRELFGALIKLEGSDPRHPALERLLGRAAPAAVARVGLELYPELATYYAARAALGSALEKVEDFAPLVEPFLEAWYAPKGIYYYGDMPLTDRFRDALAPLPEVVQQMSEDLLAVEQRPDDDVTGRCAEHAAGFLARGRTNSGLRALLELIGRWRGRARPWRLDLGAWSSAHEQLGLHGDARSFATLAHFLGTMKADHRAHRAALAGLVRIDAPRAARYILALAQANAMLPVVVALLPQLGAALRDEAIATLRRLGTYPLPEVRRLAREGLAHLAADAGPEAEQPAPEALLIHPDREVRAQALRAVHERKDASLYLSLTAAEGVDAHLRALSGDPGLPFSWHGWDARLPAAALRLRSTDTLAWAREHAEAVLGPQTILPAIEPVLAEGALAVASTYGSGLLRLSEAELAELLSEEAETLAQLPA